MKKVLVLCLAGLVAGLVAAPASFTVLKAGQGTFPAIDGDLSDWPLDYFIDSLKSDDNVYARDALEPWTPDEFQMEAYVTWDDAWVYFGIKVIRDDVIITTSAETKAHTIDNVKINPGGQAMAFYIAIDGTVRPNPSSPYVVGTSLMATMNPTGNGTFPTYEFSIQKDLLDPFMMGMWQVSLGSEENDDEAYNACCFVAVGAEYTGNKQDWNGNPWDNPLYYPTFTLGQTEGSPFSGLEAGADFTRRESLSASPNPFMPTTQLAFNALHNGTLKIYDINGQLIRIFPTKAGAHKVTWNANDLASGIYIARLTSGAKVLNTRLFLTK